MTAPVENQIEGKLARKLAPVVREMLLAEVERLAAAKVAARPKVSTADETIMEACRLVARTVDRLEDAKYTKREIAARRDLEKAALDLGRAMRKFGRMPP
ncbi:hypothetical protein [Mesorhizobium sp.]|uniref:hypothetical protein n=1 Tax=Mesorhizobium sp. TaxID=1871066 RepID=UPI000FE6A253|nr:hypothetical protein [Mesorhizobium sp.]RWE75265.1 MAG: hypothetical protein EOS42_14665 [Mesorhizobium sp.]